MKFLASIVILLAVVAKQCASFEAQVLDDTNQIAVPEPPEKGSPANLYQKGYIDDFKSEIYSWWVANDQLQLSKIGDTLKVVSREVGPKWTPFGREMALLDFSNAPVLKIRCRAEGEKPPMLIVHMKDADQYDANADSPKQRIHIGKDYRDYYFNFDKKWKQSWPDNQIVNETMIREILFFINGGMGEWTGILYIDEIKVVTLDEMPKVVAGVGGMIDDFSGDIYSWWASNEKINLETKNEALIIDCQGAGPGYETFGRAIDELDFTKAQILRVKARSEGATDPLLRIDFKDKNGHITNATPIIMKIQQSAEYKNYYYNYDGHYAQTYPDNQTVDPSGMKDILGFVNPGGEPYVGKIYIEEMEVIDNKKYQELMAAGQ